MDDYPYVSPIDAISAYCHEFSRPVLIEKLEELLLIDEAQPGAAHAAFCDMPFDIVCTTNVDFLLEQAYGSLAKHCVPLIEEPQLAVNSKASTVSLLKLHGDLHHPDRLVVTEEDYGTFLDRYPLIATFLASLLIKRTPVLIGYSLDDPDFRQLWQVVSERLGRSRRPAYSLLVDPHSHEVARYERRGVRVVGIDGDRDAYGEALARVFEELGSYWLENVIPVSEVTDEDSKGELSLPSDSTTRLCFFAVPFELQSLYRRYAFPLTQRWGFVPITADEVASSPSNVTAKIEGLIKRSHVVIVDVGTPATRYELAVARRFGMDRRILAVVEEEVPETLNLKGLRKIRRPHDVALFPEFLGRELDEFLAGLSEKSRPTLTAEPRRLLNKGEYRAAVVAAMATLEATIRRAIVEGQNLSVQSISLGRLIRKRSVEDLIGPLQLRQIQEWMKVRNEVVHMGRQVEQAVASEIVEGVEAIIDRIQMQLQ